VSYLTLDARRELKQAKVLLDQVAAKSCHKQTIASRASRKGTPRSLCQAGATGAGFS
jgi:hypothetical protein